MYLKELEGRDPPPESGRYGRAIRAAREAGRSVPQLYHLFAARPEAAKHLGHFLQEVMRGDSPLSAGQRELIAAWTSARNHCSF